MKCDTKTNNKPPPYDVVVIGGGICGLIFLKYALDANLKVLLLEKEKQVGGLWLRLPQWQDIQCPVEDWAINNISAKGAEQPQILENIQNWVSVYNLMPSIQLNTSVVGINYSNAKTWEIKTSNDSTIECRYVVVATGLHNKPYIPSFNRSQVKIPEIHSAHLHDLSALDKNRIVVVGGSASAFDVLELALDRNVPEIHWVTGTLQWMTPSSRPKHLRKGLRSIAWKLLRGTSREEFNKNLQGLLEKKYRYFGIDAIKPSYHVDFWKAPVVNGRPKLIKHLNKIHLHKGHVSGINADKVSIGDATIDCELVIYATGYELQLDFLSLPLLQGMKNAASLRQRCGTLVKSLDYPNLFFLGPTILNTNSTTQFYAATMSKSIVAHILGKTRIPDTILEDSIPHWEILLYLAKFDHYNYPPVIWWIKEHFRAWWYMRYDEKQIVV